MREPWLPEKWDREADVVVVGFGGAGAATAIAASDLGASVLMLEKAPAEEEGGIPASRLKAISTCPTRRRRQAT